MAYFLNGDSNTLSAYTALMYDRNKMAQYFSVLPHVVDDMPSADYWRTMSISNAEREAKELNNEIKGAWDL